MTDRHVDRRSLTDKANDQLTDVKASHRKIRQAWDHSPTHPLAGQASRTGPITGGDRSDPTVQATERRDRIRDKVIAEVARITLELAQLLTGLDGDERPGSARYLTDRIHQRHGKVVHRTQDLHGVLGLHLQWFGQLVKHVRTLDTPTGWDRARDLMFQVNIHASAIRRTAGWAHGQLIQPPADPDARVCERDDCQEVLGEWDDTICRICRGRDERRPLIIAAQRARDALRPTCHCGVTIAHGDTECDDCAQGRPPCAGRIRPCTGRVSEADAEAGATHCAACRKHKSRTVGTGGTFRWQAGS